jgi:hypothetical protein
MTTKPQQQGTAKGGAQQQQGGQAGAGQQQQGSAPQAPRYTDWASI